ncbi:ATPase [Pseudonocardia sp. TMWB2A]|uniref:F0F1 ATP synthase subunit B family protein n=1 Tax=Pseudonocardia sp. TMWB2A TaxID=687430 RepID=UPI00307E8DCC
MPQISQVLEIYASQIFWLLLTFGFVFIVVGLGMVPKISATVDSRDAKIAGDLAAARAAQDEADKIEEDYRTRQNDVRAEVQKITQTAKDKGAKDAEGKIAEADSVIADKMAAAEASIRSATSKALTEIEDVASEAASDLVAKLSGAKVTAAEAGKAVKAVLHV